MNLESIETYLQETSLTRRAALVGAGAGLLSFALNATPLKASAIERDYLVTQRKEAIHQTYGIKVLTLREVYNINGDLYPTTPDFQSAPLDWTMQQLDLLEIILSRLPRELFSADANGEYYVALGIGQNNQQDTPPVSSYTYYSDDPTKLSGIRMSPRHHMNPDFPLDAWTYTTHELTHLLNLAKRIEGRDNPDQNYPNHRLAFLNYHLFSGLGTARSLTDMYTQVYPVLLTKRDELADLDEKRKNAKNNAEKEQLQKQYLEESGFYWSIMYMLTGRGDDTIELYPVLAQNYVQGSVFFMKHYAEYFGLDDAQMLYRIIRDNIFFGYEYDGPFVKKNR